MRHERAENKKNQEPTEILQKFKELTAESFLASFWDI